MGPGELRILLAKLTPERLGELIQQIASTQAPDNRDGVTLGPILDALTQRRDLGSGQEGWEAYLALKQAIMDTVAKLPGMKYVEADA